MKLSKNLDRQPLVHIKRIKNASEMKRLYQHQKLHTVTSTQQSAYLNNQQPSIHSATPIPVPNYFFSLNSQEFIILLSFLTLQENHHLHSALGKLKSTKYHRQLIQQAIASTRPKHSDLLFYINSFVKIYNIPSPIVLKYHTCSRSARDPFYQTIKADVERTYVKGQQISQVRKFMTNVLAAVASGFPNFGYVQGFNYIISTMYQNGLSETQSFSFSCFLLSKMGLEKLYSNSMYRVFQYSYVVEVYLYNYIPELYKYFVDVDIGLIYFVSSWFITLFSQQLPLHSVNRLWNLFLLKGWKILIKFAIAVLFVFKESIMSQHKDILSSYLKHFLQTEFSAEREEQTFKICLSIKVKNSIVELLCSKMDQVFRDSQITLTNIRKTPLSPIPIPSTELLGEDKETSSSCYCQPRPRSITHKNRAVSANQYFSVGSQNTDYKPPVRNSKYFTFCMNSDEGIL